MAGWLLAGALASASACGRWVIAGDLCGGRAEKFGGVGGCCVVAARVRGGGEVSWQPCLGWKFVMS